MTNERPSNAWPEKYMNVADRTVLDLGCGFFGLTPDIIAGKFSWGPWGQPEPILDMITTPRYFLDLGAKKVVGVDANGDDIATLKTAMANDVLNGRAVFLNWALNDAPQIERTILEYQPDIIKADLEGDDDLIMDMTETGFRSIEEYYIEIHSPKLLASFLKRFNHSGYSIRGIHDQEPSRPVIFAYRT